MRQHPLVIRVIIKNPNNYNLSLVANITAKINNKISIRPLSKIKIIITINNLIKEQRNNQATTSKGIDRKIAIKLAIETQDKESKSKFYIRNRSERGIDSIKKIHR